MICSVILVNELSQLRLQLKEAYKQRTDLVEIRLDAMQETNFIELKNIIAEIPIPYILSLRSEWLNKEIKPPSYGRHPFIKEILKFNPPYVSFEYPLDISLLNYISNDTIPVITLVDFEGMAKIAFNSVLPLFEKYPNSILKISATPNNTNDILTLWRWAKISGRKNIRHVILGMGMKGRITRVKSKELKNEWTYARINLKHEEPQIPGMLPIKLLKKSMQKHSMHFIGICDTDNIHIENVFNTIIDRLSLASVYLNVKTTYIPDLNQLLLWAKDRIVAGIYIGKSWQKQVIKSLDIKKQSVINTGKCNMVMMSDKGLVGYNTMVDAIIRVFRPFSKKIKRVYIEGTDINLLEYITALRHFEKIEEIVIRTQDREEVEVLTKINNKIIHVSDSFSTSFDVFINSKIPAKGFENVLPVNTELLSSNTIIIDPLSTINKQTPLIKYAIEHNISYTNGWGIFLPSLIKLSEIWLEEAIPLNVISERKEIEQEFNPINHLC